jgi:uncharacterized protein YggE
MVGDSITPEANMVPPGVVGGAAGGSASGSGSVPVEPGQQAVSVTVSVTWELK